MTFESLAKTELLGLIIRPLPRSTLHARRQGRGEFYGGAMIFDAGNKTITKRLEEALTLNIFSPANKGGTTLVTVYQSDPDNKGK